MAFPYSFDPAKGEHTVNSRDYVDDNPDPVFMRNTLISLLVDLFLWVRIHSVIPCSGPKQRATLPRVVLLRESLASTEDPPDRLQYSYPSAGTSISPISEERVGFSIRFWKERVREGNGRLCGLGVNSLLCPWEKPWRRAASRRPLRLSFVP